MTKVIWDYYYADLEQRRDELISAWEHLRDADITPAVRHILDNAFIAEIHALDKLMVAIVPLTEVDTI